MSRALLLISHGTVDALDDLPGFLTNIRRGHPPPKELLDEVRHRYEAIGGRSPLRTMCDDLAVQLEGRLGIPVRTCQRMWHPYAGEVLRALVDDGVDEVAVLPLAQFSAPLYVETVREAAKALAEDGKPTVRIQGADNWGLMPALLDAFARRVQDALSAVPPADLPHTLLVLSAHSLPVAIVRAGDPYEREFRASAEGVRSRLGADAPEARICFQSQGMSTGPGGRPVEWLGPTLEATLDEAARAGKRHVVVAPMGFLADHVEILYDLDVEAVRMARERGLGLSRTRSLNADSDFVDVLADIARPLLSRLDAPAP